MFYVNEVLIAINQSSWLFRLVTETKTDTRGSTSQYQKDARSYSAVFGSTWRAFQTHPVTISFLKHTGYVT